MTIPFDPVLVSAFVLALVRASTWIFVSPPFNNKMMPIVVKAGVAAAFALVAAPHVADPRLSLEVGPFIFALLTQAAVGFTLGFLTLVLVSAIQAAGSLIDLFAGFSLAALYDPFSGAQASVFGRFYQLIAATLLFTTNAHVILVNGFFRSFEAVPVGGIDSGNVSSVLTNNVGQFFVAAIEVAGPVLACLFLSELTLGLLSRAAPALNVFSLAFPLRIIVALIVVGAALPMIVPALDNLTRAAVSPFGG